MIGLHRCHEYWPSVMCYCKFFFGLGLGFMSETSNYNPNINKCVLGSVHIVVIAILVCIQNCSLSEYQAILKPFVV